MCPLKPAPPSQAHGLSDWPSGPGAACGPDVPLSPEIGLCVSMRSLPWYVQANPDTFFPRCYSLCTESEKQEFRGEWSRETWGLSVAWPPAHRTGLRAGGGAGPVPSQPSALSLGWGQRLLPLDLPRGTGERTGQGRQGFARGCPCLLSTHLEAVEMRLLSSTHCPAPGPQAGLQE